MNSNETSTSLNASANPLSADAVSRRAYELWEQEGRPEGSDLRHWLQAEQELRGDSSTPAANGKASNGNSAAPAPAATPGNTRPANTDTRPLQGTRGGGAAKRAVTPPPFERAPAGSGTTTTATTAKRR